MLPFFMATSINLISMEREEESRRAALIAKLKSDPVHTLHYQFGDNPPSIKVSPIHGPQGSGGSHGLPKPKSPIEKDTRFRSIGQQDKLRLEGYSREQIKSHLRSQWEQVQANERYLGQPIPLKGHDKAYGSFQEFALDNFNLYQCKNFLEYFKTLPGYHGYIKKMLQKYHSDKEFSSFVDKLDDIDGHKNDSHYKKTDKLVSLLSFGTQRVKDSKRDKRAFRDALIDEIRRLDALEKQIASRLVIENEVAVPGHIDTPTIPKLPSFPATERDIDRYTNRFMAQLPGRGIRGFIPEDNGIFKGIGGSLQGTSSAMPTDVGTSVPAAEKVVGISGNVDRTLPVFSSLPAGAGEIDGYVNKFMAQLPGRGIPGFTPGDDLGILKGFSSMTRATSTMHTDARGGGALMPPPTKKPRLEETPITTLPAVIPGPTDKDQPSILKEGLKSAGVNLLKEAPGILNSLLRWYSGPQQQQPVVPHQFSFSPSQHQSPVHAGLMPPSAEFIPPFAQFSSQPEQVFSVPRLPVNKRPFREISSSEQRATTFMDEDIPGPPAPQPGPTITTTKQNPDAEIFIDDPIAEAEKIAYGDVGTDGSVATLRDGSQINLGNLKRFIDKNKEYNTDLLRIAGDNPEIHSTCEVVNRLDELAEIFNENFDPEVARMLTALSRYTIRAEQRIIKGFASGIRNFNPVTAIANSFVGVAKLGTFLIGEIAKVEGLERSVLTGDIDKVSGHLHQELMAQREAASQLLQRLKSVTWEEALEHSSEIAMDMLLFYGSTKFVGLASQKFISEFTKLTEAIKVDKAVSAAAGKTTTISESFVQNSVIGAKAYLEYGAEDVAKFLTTIKSNPGILTQQNKTVIEIMQEVAEQSHLRPNPGYRPPEPHSSTPVFGKNFGIEVNTHRQFKPTMIYGREYSGHTLQRMTERGLTPMTIENVIKSGQVISDVIPGRLDCYDKINNVTAVICGKTGNVITIFFGKPAGLR